MKGIKQLFVIYGLFAFALSGCSGEETKKDSGSGDTTGETAVEAVSYEPIREGRGRIISSVLEKTLTVEEIVNLPFSVAELPTVSQDVKNLMPLVPDLLRPVVKYGIRVYKVVYETIGARGEVAQASGTIIVPDGLSTPLPMLSYQHGIVYRRYYRADDIQAILVAPVIASTGYLGVMPDYLGHEESPGVHPGINHTLASAVIDMIRAARTFAGDEQVALNGQLFLMGYSEGGYATLAAQKEMETNLSGEFTITASAPVAGPYLQSLVTVKEEFEDGVDAFNFLYGLMSYNAVYQVYESLAEVLKDEWETTLLDFFEGDRTPEEQDTLAATLPADIFDPAFLSDLKNNTDHGFWQAWRANDLHTGWVPKAPIRLYHCQGDEVVSIEHSQRAYESLIANGAEHVELILKEGSTTHQGCTVPSLFEEKAWLDTFL